MSDVERGVSISVLREMFDLDSLTGVIRWRIRPISHFKDTPRRTAAHSMNRTNSAYAGRVAFTSKHQLGYLRAELGGKLWQAHRVAFALHNGRFPVGDVDHINGDPRDNRPENLRETTHEVNMRNSARRADNKSGHPGVYFDPRCRKWIADLRAANPRYLGSFDSFEEALAVRRAAQQKLGFHENHGRARDAT